MADIGATPSPSGSDVMGAVSGSPVTKALFADRSKAVDSLAADAAIEREHGADLRAALTKSRADTDDAVAKTGALNPPKIDPAPTPKPTDLMSQFGSPAMFIAALGSRMTRTPLTSSLNASAAVLNAYKANDTATAQKQYEIWKTNTDNALKLHEFQMEAYKQALSKGDKDQASALAEYQTYAAAFKDDTALMLARTGGIDAAIQHQDAMRRMDIEMRGAIPKLEEQHDRAQALGAVTKARDDLMKAQGLGPEVVAAKTQALEAAVQRMRDVNNTYNPSFAASESRAAANPMGAFVAEWRASHNGEDPPADELARFKEKTAVVRSAPAMAMKKFAEEHPDATSDDFTNFAADYRSRGAAVQAFATGKQGDIVRSFNTATSHLETLEDLGKALKNGETQKFNEIAQNWSKQTGNPAPTNFDAVRQIVGAEIVKSIVGAAGGSTERERAENIVNKLESPAQIEGAIGTLKELMAGQLQGLKRQYEDTTHRSDFDARLTGAAARAMGGTRAAGGSGGGQKYDVGQIVERGGKRYRVTGGDPSDPDVEEVK